MGGNVPYGYTLGPEKGLVINEEEALIVRKMFQMYAFGREGMRTFYHKLDEAGHRKRSGQKWTKQVILHMIRNPIYVGKIRWREVIYEGTHQPIASGALFDKSKELLKDRMETLSGRRFDNGDERLLASTIHCAKCKTHMVGVSTRKQCRKFPYYLCNKRWRIRECDQDYVRANLLEAAIIKDIRTMLRDEDFMVRPRAKANELLVAEKPGLEKELARIDGQTAKVRAKIDRYFEAFEAGTMKPDLCNQKVKDLTATLEALEIERRELAARKVRLTIPPVDKEMLSGILSQFEETMAYGTNPQKKHLPRQVVKKVLIHDRRTVEVWYCLPNRASVRTAEYLAPHM